MIQVKRTVITTINRVVPGLIDESSITSNEKVKKKFDAVLSKNLSDVERNISAVPLDTMSTSLTTIDKFLASYSFFHTQTKTLIWNMFYSQGPNCQDAFFKALEASPDPGKSDTVPVHIGIIYGHMFDFLFKDPDRGRNFLSPVFDKVYHEKGRGNKPRPFIRIGNLYLDFDPFMSLIIPRKCTGNPKEQFGSLYYVGDVVLYHETFPSSLIRILGDFLIPWNVDYEKHDRSNDRGSFEFVLSILSLLKKYDKDFKKQCLSRLDNKFMKSLSIVENTKTYYTLELDDGLCKESPGNVALPKELSSYHNKSVTLPHKQQLASYHLLLDYAMLQADEKQRQIIQMVKDFSNIYEHSLEEANPEKEEGAKFYFYDEIIVNVKVFQKAQREYEKQNPIPKVEVLYKKEEPKAIDPIASLKKDKLNKLEKKRKNNESNSSMSPVNIAIEAPTEETKVDVKTHSEKPKIEGKNVATPIEITVEKDE
eukprot:gene8261-86_t